MRARDVGAVRDTLLFGETASTPAAGTAGMTADTPTRTTCPYCGVGCGVLATAVNGAVQVRGDPAHPGQSGRLVLQGRGTGETVDLQGRLLQPRLHGEEVEWRYRSGHRGAGLSSHCR